MNRIFAITTRGLEAVSADELAALPGITVEQIAYRRILASCHGSLSPLLSLRTVDDVFLQVGTWPDVDRARQTLEALRAASAQLPLEMALEVCRQIRTIESPPTFSITANFVGKRNYSTREIKQACATGIADQQRWSYSENDSQADLNIRVFIEGSTAVVGVRLGAQSLSRRLYKQQHVVGSLKPAVAAALLKVAGIVPGARILDPCCGAGTILIEASVNGISIWGGDINPEALAAARFNASQAGLAIPVRCWDARALPIADGSFDYVVSNLPWGRAVSTDGSLEALYQGIGAEIERVLSPSGQSVLLTNRPDLLHFKGLKCDRQIEISLFGQTPMITIWSHRAQG
ncbi:MAG TPA: methyltransferase domain-containing protein [Anaerolineales bacterium]|nr:methyltransferase domain-containing protein [Anaerolineales bacterium]